MLYLQVNHIITPWLIINDIIPSYIVFQLAYHYGANYKSNLHERDNTWIERLRLPLPAIMWELGFGTVHYRHFTKSEQYYFLIMTQIYENEVNHWT